MRTIANIFIISALVCYTFLPLYDVAMKGSITGFAFSAGLISSVDGWRSIMLSLAPYLAGFLAIVFNSLHNKHWTRLAVGCLVIVLVFYWQASHFEEIGLMHLPEVAPANDMGEGFSITGLGAGFWSGLALSGAALLTTIVEIFYGKTDTSPS